jgi:hypothetical protein
VSYGGVGGGVVGCGEGGGGEGGGEAAGRELPKHLAGLSIPACSPSLWAIQHCI